MDTSTVDTSAPAVTDGTEVMDTSEGQSVLGTEWKREGAAYAGIGFNHLHLLADICGLWDRESEPRLIAPMDFLTPHPHQQPGHLGNNNTEFTC